jgi:hypothetical protein
MLVWLFSSHLHKIYNWLHFRWKRIIQLLKWSMNDRKTNKTKEVDKKYERPVGPFHEFPISSSWIPNFNFLNSCFQHTEITNHDVNFVNSRLKFMNSRSEVVEIVNLRNKKLSFVSDGFLKNKINKVYIH